MVIKSSDVHLLLNRQLSFLKNVSFFPGLPWEQKIFNLREALGKMKVDAMVVTALDEVAWLFNMRGNDIPYTPVFRAYAVVDEKKAILYLPPEKQALHVKKHLRSHVSDGHSRAVSQIESTVKTSLDSFFLTKKCSFMKYE